MTDISKDFEFSLASPVQYHQDGQTQESHTLTLTAPSNRNRIQVNNMKQALARATMDLQESISMEAAGSATAKTADEKPVDPKEEGEQAVTLIMMSKSVDYNKFCDDFRTLLINGICTVAENVRLTQQMYDALTPDDTEALMMEYCGRFLFSSFLRRK